MIEGWVLWILLVGLAIGAAGAALLLVRLPREHDDVGPAERSTEAAWIAATVERHGGVAPRSLVEEVLDLHGAYLASPRVPAPEGASAPPVPPSAPSAPAGYVPAPLPGYGSPSPASAPPPRSAPPPPRPAAPPPPAVPPPPPDQNA